MLAFLCCNCIKAGKWEERFHWTRTLCGRQSCRCVFFFRHSFALVALVPPGLCVCLRMMLQEAMLNCRHIWILIPAFISILAFKNEEMSAPCGSIFFGAIPALAFAPSVPLASGPPLPRLLLFLPPPSLFDNENDPTRQDIFSSER